MFSIEREALREHFSFNQMAQWSFLAAGVFFTTAPLLFQQSMGRVPKTISGIGAIGSLSAFCWKEREKQQQQAIFQALENADLDDLKQSLASKVALNSATNKMAALNQLALEVTALPPWQHARWVQQFGLQGMLPSPAVDVAAVEANPKVLTPYSGNVAAPDPSLVDTFINPTDEAELKALAESAPGLIRLDGVWVDELIESSTEREMGKRANHHFMLTGETQSGKSTLAGYLISGIAARSEGSAIVAGHDPKKQPNGVDITRWLCDFTYKIDGIEAADRWHNLAQALSQKQTALVSKVGGKCDGVPEFVLLQDEVDTLYGQGKGFGEFVPKDLAGKLQSFWNYGVKYLAGLRGHMILMGQSPLSGETGLSRPTLKNLCFIALGQTSSYILNNPKDFLNHIASEQIEVLSQACAKFEAMGIRYALVRPTRGTPFVALIPQFDVDRVSNSPPVAVNPPEDTDKFEGDINPVEVIKEWVQKIKRNPTDDELSAAWEAVTGHQLNAEGLAYLRQNIVADTET